MAEVGVFRRDGGRRSGWRRGGWDGAGMERGWDEVWGWGEVGMKCVDGARSEWGGSGLDGVRR